ncbi:MAG: DUF4968 domain-containing protein [Cellulosilyticum sp.]|nr:DUF4968 domain-containing protein [Cellulosilyticum sp.]
MELGNIVDINQEGNLVEFRLEQSLAYIEFITESIVRIMVKSEDNYAISLLDINDSKIPVHIELVKSEDEIVLRTSKLIIKIMSDFKVDIYDKNGLLLCKDFRGKRTGIAGLDNESKMLLKKEGQDEGSSKESYKVEVIKSMEGDEFFYGLGEKTGFLNKKGYDYEMWNTDNPTPHVESFKQLYKSIPFLITLRSNSVFGMYFNNSYKTFYDLGKEDSRYYYFAANDGNLDYYFIYGSNMKEVIKNYTYLTGRASRPPMWSLGYHQSRWGYNSKKDIYDITMKLRKLRIPCDTIHLDLAYMEGCRVFTWNKNNFSNPKEFVKHLKDKGFNIVPIIDPGVKTEVGYKIYEEGKANQYYAETVKGEIYTNEVWPGEVAYPNFIDPEVRKWWGDHHKDLLDMGIQGIWNDMNEPASFRGAIPDDIIFKSKKRPLQHKEVHNIYGHFMCKATFEGVKKYTGKRPFILTRACYSGTQKYAAVWTGDNHSLWAHLQMSIPQICNLGLSGFCFAGADVGGYGSDVTDELLIRWYQVGCFYPFFRNHNTLASISQEPWSFGETTLNIIRKYIELRYELLPYIYNHFINQEQTGIPIMQPLVLQYENDAQVKELNDEFMLGENILVAPIVEQGKRCRLVYLPEGRWIDYWTGEEILGQQFMIKDAPLEICPIYIKKGSIIPMYKAMQYTGEEDIEELILKLYCDEGELIYYQDNGIDYAYEQGEYNMYKFVVEGNYLYADLLHKGYDKVYKKLKVIYKEKTYVVDFKIEGNIVKLRK